LLINKKVAKKAWRITIKKENERGMRERKRVRDDSNLQRESEGGKERKKVKAIINKKGCKKV